MLTLAGQLRIQARTNRLTNRRLHTAMAELSDAEFHAPRTGFFPSLAATLNQILAGTAVVPPRLDGFLMPSDDR